MSLFSIIAKLFKKTVTKPTECDQRWNEGYNAFQRGKDLYCQNSIQQALHYFDTAIDSGFEDADVYGMRAGCLQSLGFDLDAIDDFTKAIELAPEDCNTYFMRSISKGATGDLDGRLTDLHEAIRVASIDTAVNRSYNAWAKENGNRNGVIGMYQTAMMSAKLQIEDQASDEHRCLTPLGAALGPDLVSRLRAKAKRRIRDDRNA